MSTSGRLDPGVRRALRIAEVLTTLHLLPNPERLLRRPARKRVGPTIPAFIGGAMPTGITIDERAIDGPGGRLALRVYGPDGSVERRPGLVYLHGGGFVGGGARTTDRICAQLASQARLRVVSVDYRLAPEAPFPGPLDDAAAGLQWTADHADELAIDAGALAVGGDSAGGNLAAALAIRARDEGLPALRFQALLYPVLDGTLSTPSMLSYDGPSLTPHDVQVFYDAYAGSEDRHRAQLSPLHVPSAAGLPPAIIVTAGFDCLQDEGRLYAEKLQAAGVPAELVHFADVHPRVLQPRGAVLPDPAGVRCGEHGARGRPPPRIPHGRVSSSS